MKKKVKVVKKENENDLLLDELNFKSQAAMEYLMTYGWAILIIALSLAVLYSLGILNPKNFVPKTQPGACYVYRPNGPGTTDLISLIGTCGYLPMYVASFNGVDSYISAPISSVPQIFTITAWINVAKLGREQHFAEFTSTQFYVGSNNKLGTPAWSTAVGTTVLNKGTWYFATLIRNATNVSLYLNGKFEGVGTHGANAQSPFLIGDIYLHTGSYKFNGSIANVQIYNTALTPQEIQYLYQEGLGGAPIRLGSLVGWWPLNGDAKDYSGNGNHGTINGGVTFLQNYNLP
jgi:hypothetical protein